MKYYSIAETSKLRNVTVQILRNCDKSSKLKPHHTTDSGYRYYAQEQLNRRLGVKDRTRRVVSYCRVRSPKQKDDLDRQVENRKTD